MQKLPCPFERPLWQSVGAFVGAPVGGVGGGVGAPEVGAEVGTVSQTSVPFDHPYFAPTLSTHAVPDTQCESLSQSPSPCWHLHVGVQ